MGRPLTLKIRWGDHCFKNEAVGESHGSFYKDGRVAEAQKGDIFKDPWPIRLRVFFLEVNSFMVTFGVCPFYRNSANLAMGHGIGYCDIDCNRTGCEGKVDSCEKPDILQKYLNEEESRNDKDHYEIIKEKKCSLFRRPESLNIGKGLGYCDLDSYTTTCEGEISFCEKPEELKKYLRIKLDRSEE